MRYYCFSLFAACFLFPALSFAQNCKLPDELAHYINCRAEEITAQNQSAGTAKGSTETTTKKSIDKLQSAVSQNQRKQTESSSLADNSTTMTDRSSAPDLLSLALNLAGATSDPNDATVATVNLYSLAATLQQKDPLEPEFYNQSLNHTLRKVSFTLGQDSADATSSSPGQHASIYGVKVAVVDRRTELDSPIFKKIADQVRNALGLAGADIGKINDAAHNLIKKENKTQPDESDRVAIEQLFDAVAVSHLLTLQNNLDDWQAQAEKGAQLSFSFQSKLRPVGADEYRLEAIFDKGLTNRWSADTNASFEYCNFRQIGLDQRGGRISQQFEYHFGAASKPTVLTFAGDGTWMTKVNPTYKGQFKLTFTLMKGIEFPLSATYASRTDLINESDISGHFGFTFDVAKLAQLFTGKSGGN